MISKEQVDEFRRNGFLVAENAVDARQLAGLREALAGWVEESRVHDAPFGEPTADGRARFDLAPEHTAEAPALRRVNNPSEIDDAYMEVMGNSAMTDMVASLIGPDVKHHHCKINLKLPGSHTEVRYHQDFAYTPHTNDDVVTALLMLDDMTAGKRLPDGGPGAATADRCTPCSTASASPASSRPVRNGGYANVRSPSWAAPAVYA